MESRISDSIYSIITFYSILSVIILIFWLLCDHFDYWSKRGVEGPRPHMFVGNILEQFFKPKPIVELEWMRDYGKIYGVFNGKSPALTIGEPELIKDILVKDFHIFNEKNYSKKKHPIISKSLSVVSGEDWKRIRTVVNTKFSSSKIEKMFVIVNQCLDNYLDHLEKQCAKNCRINIKTNFANFTMDVIARCAFAVDINPYKNKQNAFTANAHKLFNPGKYRLFLSLFLPRYVLRLIGIRSVVDRSVIDYFFGLLRKVIDQKEITNNEEFNDFIQLLSETNDCQGNEDEDEDEYDNDVHYWENEKEKIRMINFTSMNVMKYLKKEEIMAQSWAFLTMGFETTSTLLTCAAYELALHPRIQERLYDEIRSLWDTDEGLDLVVLSELPVLDAIVWETLRLHTPVIRIGRIASEDYKLGETGITIEKGNSVEIPIYAIHHSPEYFPKPFEFNPDRFLGKNRDKMVPYSFMPFGAGPRTCIGIRFALMEAKLCLVRLVKRFKLFTTDNTAIPFKLKKTNTVLTPDDVFIGLKRRRIFYF